MEEEQSKDFQDYIIAIRKRKTSVMSIILTVFILTIIIAFVIPSKYQSSSTILIEQQEIPSELVMSTVTSYAAQQIQTIQARVMTRTNLMSMIDKFSLYADLREVVTTEELLEEMQEDIGLDIVSAEVVDPRTGRPSTATIAFSLSFINESPDKAQQVANELTSLYLSENISRRTQKAADTSDFFKDEIKRLGKTIDELEAKIAEFKQKNAGSLPELQSLNLQILQKNESELTALDTKLDTLNERRFYLNGQLSQMSPGSSTIAGSYERLKLLEVEYASARSKYSSEHPDVIRLKNEVDALRSETGTVDSSATAQELAKLRIELEDKKRKYTNDHPDVVALNEKIYSLNKELESINQLNASSQAEKDYFSQQPDNPAYISLQSQLAGIESEIKSIIAQRAKASEKIAELEAALYKAPQVEREYVALNRDYEHAVRSYQVAKEKQVRADAAKQLESESKGERFTLIEPAALPEEPVSPNRPAIILLGFILSIGCGIGFALVSDAISGTVRGPTHIQSLLGALPLVVIPYEMNLADRIKRKRIQKRVILLFILVIFIVLLVIHFLVSPLDVLWFRVLRKIDVLMA